MNKHMNNENVKLHADGVMRFLREDNKLTSEQVRRVCTEIVRRIGSLKKAKQDDLSLPSE